MHSHSRSHGRKAEAGKEDARIGLATSGFFSHCFCLLIKVNHKVVGRGEEGRDARAEGETRRYGWNRRGGRTGGRQRSS